MNVAILGCGPAGLAAAHAVKTFGAVPHIYSRTREPSELPGAMFIHRDIPGLTDMMPDAQIKFSKIGWAAGYAEKVYGDPKAPTSWELFAPKNGSVEVRPAWNIRAAYDRLWERFGLEVRVQTIEPAVIPELEKDYQLILSTIPPFAYCDVMTHHFESAKVWIAPNHHEVCEQIGDPCIVYNGHIEHNYYRTSLLFGHGSIEYPNSAFKEVPPTSTIRRGIKPLDTDCDCFPALKRIGRFGQWKKGVLVQDSFFDTWRLCREVLNV